MKENEACAVEGRLCLRLERAERGYLSGLSRGFLKFLLNETEPDPETFRTKPGFMRKLVERNQASCGTFSNVPTA